MLTAADMADERARQVCGRNESMKIMEASSETDTSLGDEFVTPLTEGMTILRGEAEPARFHPAPTATDVRAIRRKLVTMQAGFARRFEFSLATAQFSVFNTRQSW